MASFDHDTSAVETFSIDWTRDLASGETITSSTWTVDSGLAVAATGASDGVASITVSGGTDGVTYNAKNVIVTNSGNTFARTIFIMARSVA